jgi:hypothetical protein
MRVVLPGPRAYCSSIPESLAGCVRASGWSSAHERPGDTHGGVHDPAGGATLCVAVEDGVAVVVDEAARLDGCADAVGTRRGYELLLGAPCQRPRKTLVSLKR